MPHCIIEHSKELGNSISPAKLIIAVHQGAFEAGLFREKDIKTRILSFKDYQVGSTKLNFIHVTVRILAGRSEEQRAILSNAVLSELEKLSLSSTSLTVEICEIDKESYAKKLV
ncbi:MAG: 5-carboxymethyl-2-hydroxymuconate Delta-isomerase [Anaerolineae bacterium]|jgi:5-carboxymethyl-2-hydroxymuconate isomerase|nr:5-carboxymethyl-2-hydroxymuconate Delta-isomerase [Anaerolineae bacterium]MBT7190551.1 5-carboxymethyl-2-hydroxymuconate Delta-isomerase [Anaerolineae bacterium]MBT7988648.1 5-carboxymethyl-2-hydroxymuconate Delta-isomerase [Anaerolineae bacterium]